MDRGKIDRLIINSPYEEPARHWRYDPQIQGFQLADGRRSAGYIIASERSKAFDDPGVFVEIPLVNQIRPRIKAWREAGYPGVTSITKALLEHWRDPNEFQTRRFFFCQLEAIETLIWLTEAPAADKVGIDIPSDGGAFRRLCSKMATGSGKTIVMAMLIAWQVLNKVTYPQDTRFSKNVLVVAPGLTVKSRLAVLELAGPGNYYQHFRIAPTDLLERLRQGKVLVTNWHVLNWETAEQLAKKRSVDKRGPMSDEAYARHVLGELAGSRNLFVINDEAHHAWRVPAESKIKGVSKSDIEEATKWIGGLDRIERARGILACYDFSATPFAPSGKRSSEEALFDWIVSDFGLNDAIESGLVKTPRVVVRDDAVPDAKTYKSRLYHIYNDPEVKDDLNRKAEGYEPLPDLVLNGYHLLGYDWRETARSWREAGHTIPPVMITVCNRTETAARVKYAFDHRKVHIDELCDPARVLHINSKVLDMAEAQAEPIAQVEQSEDEEPEATDGEVVEVERSLTKKQQAEWLRLQVDTVGQPGKPGEQVQNVISVGMLSEGWDAKTVTHIMGLRAFSSQLLCEQVVGRGLRRTSYDVNKDTGLFEPEYVNIFGVPFTFLPHEFDGRPASAADAAQDGHRAGRGQGPVCDQLAEHRAHRSCLPAATVSGLGRGQAAGAGRRQDRKDSRACAGGGRQTGRDQGRRDRPGAVGARVSHPAHRLRDGPRCLRPDAALVAGQQRSAAGAAGASGGAVCALGQDRRPAAAVLPGRLAPAADHHAQHDQGGAARLGCDPLRQLAAARAGLRPRSPDPLHRRHGHLVHRQALPSRAEVAHQLLRLRQHLGSRRRLRA